MRQFATHTRQGLRLFVLVAVAAALIVAVVVPAQAQDEEDARQICDNIAGETLEVMSGTGSFNNIYDPARQQTGNTYCNVLVYNGQFWQDSSRIGVESVINRGVVHAVDVFGLLPDGTWFREFRTPVRICMRGGGYMVFLDANDSTRTPQPHFAWEDKPGFSCSDVYFAGTLVLVANPPAPAPPSNDPNAPADPAAVTALVNCTLTTTANGVFLRREPNTAARIRFQFEDSQTLTASGVAGGWYRIEFRGSPGWINSAYVTPADTCADAATGALMGGARPPADPNAPS